MKKKSKIKKLTLSKVHISKLNMDAISGGGPDGAGTGSGIVRSCKGCAPTKGCPSIQNCANDTQVGCRPPGHTDYCNPHSVEYGQGCQGPN